MANTRFISHAITLVCCAGTTLLCFGSYVGRAQSVTKAPATPQNTAHPSGQSAKQAVPKPVAPLSTSVADDGDGLSGDTGDAADSTGVWQIRNWTYTRGDMVVTGSTGRWNRKTDTLDTDDPIVMNDSKHHLTADKAHVEHVKDNSALRLVVLTGHAVMVLKPEGPAPADTVAPAAVQPPPAPGQAKAVNASAQQPGGQNPTQSAPLSTVKLKDPPPDSDKDRQNAKKQKGHGGTITCDRIEYRTSKKYTILTGNVVFKQSFMENGKQIERTMTCEHAENDDKANVLHLFKPVHYEDNQNQVFDTPDDVLLGTKDGEETAHFTHFKAHFPSQNDDEETTDSGSNTEKSTKTGSEKETRKPPQ